MQTDGIFHSLAAILHLSCADATQSPASKSSFIHLNNAEIAADLLGVSLEQLSQSIFKSAQTSGQVSTSSVIRYRVLLIHLLFFSRFSMSNRTQTGQEALHSFIQSLYNELFSTIVKLINNHLNNSDNFHLNAHITILDFPGGNFSNQRGNFTDPKTTNNTVNTIDDLIFNYLNERVIELSFNSNFVDPVELYNREQVEITVEKPLISPQNITRLLDRKQQLQNRLIRRHPRQRQQFILGHCQNTSPTIYSVRGWLRQIQPSHASIIVPQFLQSTKSSSINELYSTTCLIRSASNTSFKLRRSTLSIQQLGSEMGTGTVFGGFFSNISLQLDYFLSVINRYSRLHFVHCLGAVEPMAYVQHNGSLSTSNSIPNQQHNGELMDVNFVRRQIRSVFLIDTVRTHNRGYPERMPFRDFRRRFQCLVEDSTKTSTTVSGILDETLDDRACVQRILESMEIYEHRYRLGLSQILLRSDVLIELEERRDLSLSGLIVELQRECCRYLARKWLAKRRIQELAIKCIQRNINAHLKLKKWPWWNLYTKVLPILGISRSDEEQKEWHKKLVHLESTNTELKSVKAKLEDQIAEMEQLLKAENLTTQNLTLSLEHESELRLRLETELRILQEQQKTIKKEGWLSFHKTKYAVLAITSNIYHSQTK